jgi:hypothetical protein
LTEVYQIGERANHKKKEGENNMRDSSEIWTGNAINYDQVCPTPPPALLDLLTQLIGRPSSLTPVWFLYSTSLFISFKFVY